MGYTNHRCFDCKGVLAAHNENGKTNIIEAAYSIKVSGENTE